MTTPTPRTDAEEPVIQTFRGGWVRADFARQLERELAAAVSSLTCTHHNDKQRAACPVCLVAALTAERDLLLATLVYADQILDAIDTCSDAHKPMYSSYTQNVFKLCVKGRDARRAAIDAGMQEDTK